MIYAGTVIKFTKFVAHGTKNLRNTQTTQILLADPLRTFSNSDQRSFGSTFKSSRRICLPVRLGMMEDRDSVRRGPALELKGQLKKAW